MFSRDLFKWAYVAQLYENAREGAIRVGKMLGRKEFLDHAIVIQIGPEDLAELYMQGKRFALVQVAMPPPRIPQGVPQKSPANKIVITG